MSWSPRQVYFAIMTRWQYILSYMRFLTMLSPQHQIFKVAHPHETCTLNPGILNTSRRLVGIKGLGGVKERRSSFCCSEGGGVLSSSLWLPEAEEGDIRKGAPSPAQYHWAWLEGATESAVCRWTARASGASVPDREQHGSVPERDGGTILSLHAAAT